MNDRRTVMHASAHANPPTATRRDFASANAETDGIHRLRPISRRQRGWSFPACSAPFCVFFLVLPGLAVAQSDPVTFIVTSDCHYDAFENEDRNQRVRDTLREMNEITGRRWPEQLGGGPILRPRGVLVLGDVIDDGDRKLEGRHQTPVQYGYFAADFGLDGTDGLLKYPVFEGWGNHDGPPEGKEKYGFSFQAHLKKRNQIRREKGLISNVSENGLHYSWDWGSVHFVQLNLYPADRQREGVRYSADWHDPQGSLSFLKADLAEKVGQSGRPVVLMSHCGFDTDWWSPDDWREMYDSVASYHVVLYLYGHSGTGLRQWAPEGRTRKLQCVNTGQTENGFFVVELTPRRVRLAYRVKTLKVVKEPDGKRRFEWDGSWQWKHLLEEPIGPAVQLPSTAALAERLPCRAHFIRVADRPAFLLLPHRRGPKGATAWVWYAPTLRGHPDPSHEWMFRQWLEQGIAIAGVDVGESYGNVEGRRIYSAMHQALVDRFGLAPRACLLPQSRGGLMLYNWAAENAEKVACITGIYTVCDIRSWPGLARACGAFGLSDQELAEKLADHNPVDRLEPLARVGVPILHVHGDSDSTVPLETNSGELARRYRRLGGKIELIVVPGKGHQVCPEFFQRRELVDFVIRHAASSSAEAPPSHSHAQEGKIAPTKARERP